MVNPSSHTFVEVLKVAFNGEKITARVELPVVYVMVENGRVVDVRTERPEFLEAVLTAQEMERFLQEDDGDEFPQTFMF